MDVKMLCSIHGISHLISVKCVLNKEKQGQFRTFTFSQLQRSAHNSTAFVSVNVRNAGATSTLKLEYVQPVEGRLSHIQGRGTVLH